MGLIGSRMKKILLNCKSIGDSGADVVAINFGDPRHDPDEKWSNLYRERNINHLYKWADAKCGMKTFLWPRPMYELGPTGPMNDLGLSMI
jgi:hypothetical protein